MTNTMKKINAANAVKFKAPKSVQDLFPIKTLYKDGVFQLYGNNLYSKTWKFTDINYFVADYDNRVEISKKWADVLNCASVNDTVKITTVTRKVNEKDFASKLMLPKPKKSKDMKQYIDAYNDYVSTKYMQKDNKYTEKYVTVTTQAKTVEEARSHFDRTAQELSANLHKVKSKLTDITVEERLSIFHSFFRPEDEMQFAFDFDDYAKNGHDFKDLICPTGWERIDARTFKAGDKYCRCFYMSSFANTGNDKLVYDISSVSNDIVISLDTIIQPLDEAIKMAERTEIDADTNITNWQRKQVEHNNFSALIPTDLEKQRDAAREFLTDLTERDQSMFFAVMTVCVGADTLEDLNERCEALRTTVQQYHCTVSALDFQQPEAMKTVLPFGTRYIDAVRTFTSRDVSSLIPFSMQDKFETGGTYIGTNRISFNPVMVNIEQLSNSNGTIYGTSGHGKSMIMKWILEQYRMRDDSDIIVIDPEREYAKIADAFNGELIRISSTSKNHINALDLTREYGEEDSNPLSMKTEFVLSFCQLIEGKKEMAAVQRSYIDEAVRKVYGKFIKSGYKGNPPTLKDIAAQLEKMNAPEAHDTAMSLKLYTDGSLNTFSYQTNVKTDSNFIVYDTLDLGSQVQMQSIGMLVVLDSIWNRITANRQKKRKTKVFIDELHLLFKNEVSAGYVQSFWKRCRKFGASCIGATQNVGDMLESNTAREILSNSEFTILFNQNDADIPDLESILDLSDEQEEYIRDVEPGLGLLKVNGSLYPVNCKLPTTNIFYQLNTSKMEDDK